MLEMGNEIRGDILLSAKRDFSGSQENTHTHSSSGFVIIPDFHLLMNSEIVT